MNVALRHRLMASTLFMGLAGISAPAFAQAAGGSEQVGDSASDICASNPNAAECLGKSDAIVVTGSRIASPTLNSPSPLQVIDARDIQDSGQINVQNVLQENPAVSAAPTYSRTNSNFLTSSGGVASIDLRNLGTSRTLVLINGHRTVAGVPGTNIVDLNTVPSQFIERIEVLTGGASSVYGSDAIAGVVNFIYKKDFTGIQLDAQTGITERGDGQSYQLGGTIGTNFADDRGNVMIYGGYTKEDGVFSRDRNRSAIDQSACYVTSEANGGCANAVNGGDNTNLFTAYRPFYSSFRPGGTITFGGLTRVVNAGGELAPVNTNGLVHVNDGVLSTVRPCSLADPCRPTLGNATGFNRSAFRTIAIPVERYLLALRGNYEITDKINATLEGNFARTTVTTLIEPFPFQTSGVNGTAPNACLPGVAAKVCGGFHPIQTRLADGTIVRNPYVQDAIFNAATDRTGDGLKDVSFTRRLSDFGPRTYTARRETFRVLAGLDGSIFDDKFRWDAFYTYGETTESQVGSGQVNLPSFTNALEAIPGANGPICADATARAQGCQPANVFGGPGSISSAAVTYIQAGQTRNTNIQQTDIGANLSGDLFTLWDDNAVGVAVGVEYRKEVSAAVNDALTVAGLNGGNAIANTFGQFDVKEAYGEIAIPLISHRPFFETLTLRAAGRVSDYSLKAVGTVYSYNAGVEFAPVKDIRFRAVYAKATRAPNIGELFAGRSQTFPTGLIDPCLGVTATSTTAQSARCRQDLGVLNNIAQGTVGGSITGVFANNQSDTQGVSGFNSGNPNLSQETGKTFTAGVVINPVSISALRNLVLTVDYFNIKISNLITANSRQGLLNACYGRNTTQDETACTSIIRRVNAEGPNSPGSIQFVNIGNINSGRYQTTGVDATLSYRTPAFGGTLLGKVAYTHVFKLRDPSTGSTDNAGEVGAPFDRASGSVSYSATDFTLTARANYIGNSYLDSSFSGVQAGTSGSSDYAVGSYFTMDLQARFKPTDTFEFFAGVNNLLDTETPLIISGLPGDNTGTETDAGTYDPIGRRFYAGVKMKF